jgi:pimeloyl-ACP methyl ester carboxylesterase/DNA-binding winged helix-turn-helix (wHTH) protein/class 3 adenylate cyclase
MNGQKNKIYAFGQFRLDAGKRLLFAGDELVNLRPKTFDTLLALVENSGSVMSKEDLMSLLWADEFVEENNLAQHIHAIRKSLGARAGGAKYIETIPRRGYRFAADVAALDEQPPAKGPNGQSGANHAGAIANSAVFPQLTPRRLRSATFLSSRPLTSIRPQTQYAVSDGDVNIAYQVVGDGPIDLVFVMGWVSHLEYFWQEPSFARFLLRLASFSRLILFDKRGTGLSDQVALTDLPTLEQRMTDVQAVMNAVGSERAALLGVSEGGPMCGLFAATYPERTEALVMIGSYAKRLWSEDYPWAPTERERADFMNEVKKNWGGPIGLEERAPSMAGDPQFREWWGSYLRLGTSPAAALAMTRMNAEVDVRSVLPSIRAPTLVIHRKDDACLPVEGGRFIASRIPGAKYVELEGRDHLPFVGDQDAILDEIEEFLTGARTGAWAERLFDRVLTTVLFVLFDDPAAFAPTQIRQEMELRQSYARREIAIFRGKEIEMTDDHLFATFDGPARAIRCALAIVDAMARLGERARAGLHTGECDVKGETIGGLTVQLSESVARLASFGEVLISHTVKDLVAGAGIEFEPRGEHVLENLPGEWRLFAAGRGVISLVPGFALCVPPT